MHRSARIIAILILIILILTACGKMSEPAETLETETDAAETETGSPETDALDLDGIPEKPFEPVLRFLVCSDVHVTTKDCVQAERLNAMMETAYEYAASQTYPSLDAAVFVGDLTDHGTMEESHTLRDLLRAAVREETTVLTMLGNHEYNKDQKYSAYKQMIDKQVYHDITVKGYHFIAISPDTDSSVYSEKETDWLAETVAAAAAEAPYRPIFTFQHHYLEDTVENSRGKKLAYSAAIRAAYDPYPQIINFSGHSHAPINHPLAIYQDNFTMVTTGTLSYFEMDSGMTDGVFPEGYQDAAQFYIVEVNAENAVKIMPYDLIAGDFFKTPSNTDDPDTQLVYLIEHPEDPSTYRYTDQRAQEAGKPRFEAGAEVTVSDITPTSAVITVPQALDDSCIYSYILTLIGDDFNQYEYRYFSGYYHEPLQETVSYEVSGLVPSMNYLVRVDPVNAWGATGESILTEFTTAD